MKTVSRRIRQDGQTYFRFELRSGRLIYQSRYALVGRVWAAIVTGVKALEFDDLDQLDRLLYSLATAFRTLDDRNRSAGIVVEEVTK